MRKFSGFALHRGIAARAGFAFALCALLCTRAGALSEAATVEVVNGLDDHFATTAGGSPVKTFVTTKFVFALEQAKHRVAVHNRTTGEVVSYFGANATKKNGNITVDCEGTNYTESAKAVKSSKNGGFNQPQGMALDKYSSGNRFAVADTKNNRVQLFKFNASSGKVEFVCAFGTKSPSLGANAADGTFSEPQAVAFTPNGELLVADTGNNRVVKLSISGTSMTWGEVFAFDATDVIMGVCFDNDGADGFWVANASLDNRHRVSFHHMSGFSPTPDVSLGADTSDAFSSPSDVQTWDSGDGKYVVVADKMGSRVRILKPVAGGSGAYGGLRAITDIGKYKDPALEEYQQLWQPAGVFPVDGKSLIYVANTGQSEIKWYGVSITEAEGGETEEYEEVGWPITSFAVTDGGTQKAVIGWAVPTENLPADGGDLTFKILYRPSLAEAWDDGTTIAENPIAVPQSNTTFIQEVDISGTPFSGSPSGFFTLVWTNKVK